MFIAELRESYNPHLLLPALFRNINIECSDNDITSCLIWPKWGNLQQIWRHGDLNLYSMIFCVWHFSFSLTNLRKNAYLRCVPTLWMLYSIYLGGDVIARKNDVTVTSFHVLSGGTSTQINWFGPWSHYTKSHAFSRKVHNFFTIISY